jgi:hypothetical protein
MLSTISRESNQCFVYHIAEISEETVLSQTLVLNVTVGVGHA